MNVLYKISLFAIILFMTACQSDKESGNSTSFSGSTLFTKLPSSKTNINFSNDLDYDKKFNVYTYRNFYNGGGVAIGDVNNDGLPDVYLTGNMRPNRLYINKGDFEFEDITEKAGVKGSRKWSTGVSMVDINADGWMDIYVCNSGDVEGDDKENELFINQKDGTFKEEAEAYGIADKGYSTHAAFFDFDKDGDLDLYLLNNSYQAIGSFNLRKNIRPKRDPVGGDKFFRNDGGTFVDISEAAGIYGSVIGFGLGVTVGDIDKDGWQDIYICNDFFERDYIYMNNGDGTFRENLTDQMRSISGASMGADMADLNNDAYPEIFVTEMLPESEKRLKTTMTFENWDRYQYNVENGYYHQFTRNMLHLNNTDGTFSEIGRLAGVEATDWSWGAMIADLDNDGYKDLFVANGIYQDILNQDYLNFIANEEVAKSIITEDGVDFKKLIDIIDSNPVPNYAFRNKGDATFENAAKEWGLDEPVFSNGSAYGDLDNDGDLDMVVNNVNSEAFVYKNNAQQHYLKFILKGADKNTFGIGANITLHANGQQFYLEQMPMRGFQSSMDYRPHFGLGEISKIDKIEICWLNGKCQVLTDIEVNQTITASISDATIDKDYSKTSNQKTFKDITKSSIQHTHEESKFVDFDRDRLIFHKNSTQGPCLAVADINADGLEDFYVGGAKGNAGTLYIQQSNGKFKSINKDLFEKDKKSEDVDCIFFDANGDGVPDLYVASGSNEDPKTSSLLRDRLYFNNGKGQFSKANQVLPAGQYESSACVDAADFDKDGDLDLFVGIRFDPYVYGVPSNGYILENDGQGNFKSITKTVAPDLKNIGMITDAQWTDTDNDGDEDLLIVGDWMSPILFINEAGNFTKSEINDKKGWWNKIEAADFNADGLVDFVVTNHGLNSRFCATEEEPVQMYINDFDRNGTAEHILCCYNEGESYPMALRHDLVMQMPHLKKKYLKYENYYGQTINDIFDAQTMERSVVLDVNYLESAVLINQGNNQFEIKALPHEAQYAPMFGIEIADFDKDGKQDLLLAGNFYGAKPEVGRYDADYGLLLKGDGQGDFKVVKSKDSGFQIDGEVRVIEAIKIKNKKVLLVAKNNDSMQVFSY